MDEKRFMQIFGQALKAYGQAESRGGVATLERGLKHDVSSGPITVGYSHGPGGFLTYPGVDPVMFQTVVGSRTMLGQLPSMPSVFTNPTYFTITGVGADTGSEKDDVCDEPPVAGLVRGCLLTSVSGRYERGTPILEVNRLGQRNDRADPMDLTLVGSPIGSAGIFGDANTSVNTPQGLFTNEVTRKFWERNVSFHRLLSRQLWQGNPSNNSNGGGYKEMTGFDILINTGHVDAETGASCPALDSDIKSFGNLRVDDNGEALVAALSYMVMTREDLADRTGLSPVRYVLAMRPELFWEITAVWPCAYLTYRCSFSNEGVLNVDATDQVRMRDDFRANQYLPINGKRYDVILDDGIAEDDGNDGVTRGCFRSDIYLIPMSVVGGRSVTFLEYMDYSNPSIQSAIQRMGLFTVEGAFMTTVKQTLWCLQWFSKIEPRLVMRTPWLAGRLTDVVYCPLQHINTAFPDDPYYLTGGKTSRPGPSLYDGF